MRAVQADFFLDRPEEDQRRVRQLVAQNRQRGLQHDRHARPIVGPQASRGIGRADHVSLAYRLAADADRHGIHVGHQQPPRRAHGAGQFER